MTEASAPRVKIPCSVVLTRAYWRVTISFADAEIEPVKVVSSFTEIEPDARFNEKGTAGEPPLPPPPHDEIKIKINKTLKCRTA